MIRGRAATAAALLTLLLAPAACGGDPGVPPPRYGVPPGTPVNVAYRCADGQSPVARFHADGRATLRLDDQRAVELEPVEAASGARYAGGGVELWTKEREALLTVEGRETTCREFETD
jgi:membrane-bound inhibitor of C-type lysozyme